MGPAAAWAVPAGVGLFGTLFGSHQQQQGAQQAASGQTAINQILAPYAEQLLNEFQSNYAGLEPAATGGLSGAGGAAGATLPQNLATYLNELVNPQYLQNATGIPLQQGQQSAYGYFENPGGTTLQQTGAGVLNSLTGEMNTGIDPSIIHNIMSTAVGQQDMGTAQTIANIRNSLGGGTPNLAGTIRDVSNAGFSNDALLRANLGSNLASASQGFKQQAAGMIPGIAGSMDAQTAQWLQNALGIGTSAEQQRLGQEGTAVGTATGIDQIIQQIIASGASTATPGLGVLGNIGQQYAGAGAAIASQPNPWSGLATTLAGLPWGGSGGTSTTGPNVINPNQLSGIPMPSGPSPSYTPGLVTYGGNYTATAPTYGGNPP